jgi:hypothetical protein
VWSPNLKGRLPRGWWKCPNDCIDGQEVRPTASS